MGAHYIAANASRLLGINFLDTLHYQTASDQFFPARNNLSLEPINNLVQRGLLMIQIREVSDLIAQFPQRRREVPGYDLLIDRTGLQLSGSELRKCGANTVLSTNERQSKRLSYSLAYPLLC